jgi:hypothetical protein
MDKEIIKAMATKFSEIFAISMLKKPRKFCRRGLTHLDATPTFQKSSKYIWDTRFCYIFFAVDQPPICDFERKKPQFLLLIRTLDYMGQKKYP